MEGLEVFGGFRLNYRQEPNIFCMKVWGFLSFRIFPFQYLLKNKPIISKYFNKESTLHSGVLFVRLVKDMNSGIVDCSCICISWNGEQEWVWLQLVSLFRIILVWYIHVLGSFQIKSPA